MVCHTEMREDLKGHNLTFTEIAKLVGENWQSLPPTEKEAYESQASSAKEKYQRDLVEYKKTPEWRKYAQYLQEFKENQAKPNPGSSRKTGTRVLKTRPSLQSPDANKRPKIEPARLRHGSTSSSAATGGNTSSGSGSASTRDSRSSSERMQGSEPPPTRQERVNSVVDATESHPSLAGDATMSYPIDESRLSPRTAGFDLNGGRDSSIRNMPLRDGGGIAMGGKGARQHLPSLSNMLDDGRRPNPPAPAADSNPYTRSGFVPEGAQPPVPDRLRVIPPAVRGPMLCHDESSTGGSGSGSSGSPVGGFGPSLGDGPLPIHALLSNRAVPQPAEPRNDQSSSPPFVNSGEPTLGGGAHNPRGYGS